MKTFRFAKIKFFILTTSQHTHYVKNVWPSTFRHETTEKDVVIGSYSHRHYLK